MPPATVLEVDITDNNELSVVPARYSVARGSCIILPLHQTIGSYVVFMPAYFSLALLHVDKAHSFGVLPYAVRAAELHA
jgi:hypothetical protein